MKPARQTPTTTLVEEALRSADDFMRRSAIESRTGRKPQQICAALHLLRKYRVVDVIVDPDGVGWWYARPPEDDTRLFTKREILQDIKRKQPGSPRKGTTRTKP